MNQNPKNLEYKLVSEFSDWASWNFKGEGVYGITQSPEGIRGVVVRNPWNVVQVYVLKDELDYRQEKEALNLIVKRNKIFDQMGRPSDTHFNNRDSVKQINRKLMNYLLDCYTERLQVKQQK